MRLLLKVTLGFIALSFLAVLYMLGAVSAGANRLDSGWSRRLPIDRPFNVIDKPGSSAIAGSVNHRFVGLYKVESGALLWRYALGLFAKHQVVKAVGAGGDGNTIAAATTSGKIVIFDRYANRKQTFAASFPATALVLSGDGSRLAQVGEDGRIYISDTLGGNGSGLQVGGRPLKVSLNKRGDKLLLATANTLEAWSANGRKIWLRPLRARKLSIAADHKGMAVVDNRGRLSVYSGSGRLRWTYKRDGPMPGFSSVALSGSGAFVASAGAGKLYLFNRGGNLINVYRVGGNEPLDLAFTAGERMLISGNQGSLTGLLVGEAVDRATAMRVTARWASPTLFVIMALILANLFAMRRLARPAVIGEVLEFPESAGKKGRRKAA